VVEQGLDELAEHPQLGCHRGRLTHGAAQDEAALEGGEEVVATMWGVA
jgi:hypothetical protein